MARIRCKYIGCTYLDGGICNASTIELDPDEGCLTYAQFGDPFDDDWDDEEELDGYEEWDEDDFGNMSYDDDEDY